MNKVFKKAKDKNVAAVVLYLSEGALYYDAEAEQAVEYQEDAIELFFSDAVILNDGSFLRPSAVSEYGEMLIGEITTAQLPARPEPELPEDVHTVPPNKWNDDLAEEQETEEPSEPEETH